MKQTNQIKQIQHNGNRIKTKTLLKKTGKTKRRILLSTSSLNLLKRNKLLFVLN